MGSTARPRYIGLREISERDILELYCIILKERINPLLLAVCFYCKSFYNSTHPIISLFNPMKTRNTSCMVFHACVFPSHITVLNINIAQSDNHNITVNSQYLKADVHLNH